MSTWEERGTVDPRNWNLNKKRVLRLVFLASLLCVLLVFTVNNSAALLGSDERSTIEEQATLPPDEREPVAPPRDGITVFSSHLQFDGELIALAPSGRLLYYDDRHDGYFDVDPEPRGESTVLYSATDRLPRGSNGCEADTCVRQVVEVANLSTGEVTELYSQIDPQYEASEWHDVDRIGNDRLLVADMYDDEVFIVNYTSGIVEWGWDAQQHFPLESGGPFPHDWAHINDVEQLADGRIMVSIRNQDRVVFIDRRTGVIESATIGRDHDVLYAQHNPDYIPAENGGPAVLIADSENNRIVEYQRDESGEWQRSWQWRDAQLQWARDADRLPNGHTLITDSHGGRIIEIDRQGRVVWSVPIDSAYEAERLSTGPESAGGQSAQALGLSSRSVASEAPEGAEENGRAGILVRLVRAASTLVPGEAINGILAVSPLWMTFGDVVMLAVLLLGTVLWAVLELWWRKYRLRVPLYRRPKS